MKDIISNLSNSFNNINLGYSGKKLTAFVITLCCVAAHVKWVALGDFKQLEMVLTIDYSFIAVLFGINTYDKKVKKDEPKEPS